MLPLQEHDFQEACEVRRRSLSAKLDKHPVRGPTNASTLLGWHDRGEIKQDKVKEWIFATANASSWGPMQTFIDLAMTQDTWRPDVIALQEHRLSNRELRPTDLEEYISN